MQIAIVCEKKEEQQLYVQTALEFLSAHNANTKIISNPIPDKNAYDAVIFVFENNPSDNCHMLNSLVGHQHIVTVWGKDSTEKLHCFKRTLMHTAGIPVPLETERKYLISYPDTDMLNSMDNCCPVSISQTYLDIPGTNARIRKRTVDGVSRYIKTEKTRVSDATRIEIEEEISPQQYTELMAYRRSDMVTIDKTRYCLLHNGRYFEIDVFPMWQDVAYAEIELIDEDEYVELPPYLNVIKDVTNDARYTNKSLAKLIASGKTDMSEVIE